MGNVYGYQCTKCSNYVWFSTGVGFLFPFCYEKAIDEIKAGKWGEEYQEFFEAYKNAATDVEEGVYLCEYCGEVFNEMNRGMYISKDENQEVLPSEIRWCVAMPQIGKEYVTSYDLAKNYYLYKKEIHNCPKCGKPTKQIKEDDIEMITICRKCNQKMKLVDLEFWD